VVALVALVLVSALAAFAVQVAHAYADDRRDAARLLVEVEADASDQIVAAGMLARGELNARQFRVRIDTLRAGTAVNVATLWRTSPGVMPGVERRRAAIDTAVSAAAAAQLRGDLVAATWMAVSFDALQTYLRAEVDRAQKTLLAAADTAGRLVDVVAAVIIAVAIVAVSAVVAWADRRRRRLARVELEAEALRQSEEIFRVYFDSNPQPMYVFDLATLRLVAVNDTAVDFYGYSRERMLQMTLLDVAAPDERADMTARMEEIRTKATRGRRVRHVTGAGRVVQAEVHSRMITYRGRPAKLTLVVDVTERTSLESELRHQAFHDALTGLANRALFLDRVEHAMARRGGDGALLLLDLDGFKTVNDSLGHVAGDELLVAVGARLSDTVRPGDTIARLGGDEFAILLEGAPDGGAGQAACERVLEAMRTPFQVGDRSVSVGASIGMTLTAGEPRGADAVLREADIAMYVAKAQGKGTYQLFDASMHADVMDRLALEQDLRHAVDNGELRLVYQPKVDAGSGRATAAEALVRWQHPVRGLVPPDRFIPLAEEVGLITGIDTWVLDAACTQAAAWIAAGLALDHVAVNISGRELQSGGLLLRVRDALERSGLAGERLEIELTEGSAVHQAGPALDELSRIRAMGVSIAIDDFGTGYSMLSRLQDFPVDRLKIDKSFIEEIGADGTAPLVVAMIAMGHELGLQVVAEGVETADQLSFLRSNGCDQVQGYLLAHPLDPTALEQVVGTVLVDPLTSPAGAMQVALQAAADAASAQADPDRLVRVLLAELERLTGLESTYLTRIDTARGVQEILAVHNVGKLQIGAGLRVPLEDTVCIRALRDHRPRVRSLAQVYPEAAAALRLGIESFVTVPVLDDEGGMVGTLCGASSRQIDLPDSVVGVMELFARLISTATAAQIVAV
jgi:diguanylate cyclase (GGDEF)-like protein/PAS domain S-box-containing protein